MTDWMNIKRFDRIFKESGDRFITVDTCKTPDAGWETAVAWITKERFAQKMDGWDDATVDDFADYWGECNLYWDVVENYRTEAQAKVGHAKWGCDA